MTAAVITAGGTGTPERRRRRAWMVAAAAGMGLALIAVAAQPAHAASRTQFDYRIVQVTHRSATSGTDDVPAIRSTASSVWTLARPTRRAPNRLSVNYTPIGVTGGGTMNLRGTYRAHAVAQRPRGTVVCDLVAPTGSRAYGLAAPRADMLSVAGGRRGLTVYIGPSGGSPIATSPSGGGYFESDCTNNWSTPPPAIDNSRTAHVAYPAFKRKRITLHFNGRFAADGVTSHWATTIVLTRIDPHPRRR